MSNMKRLLQGTWLIYALMIAASLQAQPTEKFVKVIVAPDRVDWTYKPGEKVKFTITVLQNGNPVKDAKISYQVGPEKMNPGKEGSETLAKGPITIDGGTIWPSVPDAQMVPAASAGS